MFGHLCFYLDREFAKTYVFNALDRENCYRSQCVLLGYKLELQHKKKLCRALKQKGIEILAKFNYLENVDEPDGQDDTNLDDLYPDCTSSSVVLENHDNSYFKRTDLARILLEHEFLHGRKE